MTVFQRDNRELQQKIDEYSGMLLRLAYLRLGNLQDAQDVVQEAFYQYLKRREPFESAEHEKAWLLKVALNASRKIQRSPWNRRRSPEEWQKETETLKNQDLGENPESDALRREENRRLLAAVMQLPARYREVIHLFYYQELSVKEIAAVTGRRESTVTSQLTRGRGLLRKALKEEYDFGEF